MELGVFLVNMAAPAPARSFRIGTTSFILPQDILSNVRFLAGKVQDVELLIFEVDDRRSPLLSAEAVTELADLAQKHGLSYTVHLPMDLRLAANDERGRESLELARRVMKRMHPLHPWAYIIHLEGGHRDPLRTIDPDFPARLETSLRALKSLAKLAGGSEYLALENMQGRPPDNYAPILQILPVSLCLDVGHLWLEKQSPGPFLKEKGDRIRVVHLHGVDASGRDHQSLARVPPEKVDPVARWLLSAFSGVLTLEVFGLRDFSGSMEALAASLERSQEHRRIHGGDPWAGD